MRKTLLPVLAVSLLLAACGVDTTGLSAESTRPIHPKSNPNAAVTVTEYADFECPACGAAYSLITKPVLDKYGSQIRYEHKHFPLTGIHRYALEAAQATECAADQGKFWEYAEVVFTKQEDLSSRALRDWAAELKFDTALFERCLSSKIKRDTVLADQEEGRKLGVSGTPSFFVNDQRVESDVEAIGKAVDAAIGAMAKHL